MLHTNMPVSNLFATLKLHKQKLKLTQNNLSTLITMSTCTFIKTKFNKQQQMESTSESYQVKV